MSDHTHRPTYFNFVNTKCVCRCKHCEQPLKCKNRWLVYIGLLPALPLCWTVMKNGLDQWPLFLVGWGVYALLQVVIFFRLRFEVDEIGVRDDFYRNTKR